MRQHHTLMVDGATVRRGDERHAAVPPSRLKPAPTICVIAPHVRIVTLAVAATLVAVVSAGAPLPDSDRLTRAKDLIASEQWSGAVKELRSAIADRREPSRDEALFWLAHSLHETGEPDDALATIDRLEREYPRSRWVKPARSLRIEIAGQQGRTDLLLAPMAVPRVPATGHRAVPSRPPVPPVPPAPPGLPPDLDLQLETLQVLMDTSLRHGIDTAPTVTVLADLARSGGDPSVRRRALFILAQTRDPRAREVIQHLAESGTSDVRVFAVQQLGLFGGADARQPLIDIYQAGSPDVKRQVLKSFRARGDRGALVDAARRERDRALRDDAIQQLGLLGSRRELMDLYTSGLPATGKILEALFAGGAREELLRISRDASNAQVRAAAAARAARLDPRHPSREWDRLARDLEKAAADAEKDAAAVGSGESATPRPRHRTP